MSKMVVQHGGFAFFVYSILFGSIISSVATDSSWLWTYEDQTMWSMHSKSCGKQQQSPIDIFDDFCEPDNNLDLQLQHFAHPYSKGVYYWQNDGHTYKLTKGNSNNDRHIVTGSIVDDERYAFRQLHLHWNRREKSGTEHSINGERFALEVHFVNEKLNHDSQRNQLVVLSSLFKIGRHNSFFDELIESISLLTHTNDNVTMVVRDPSKSIADALPRDTSRFYSYDGSLTTPNCDENVRWIVFKEIQEISAEQLSAIRLNHKEKANVRMSQQLNHRLIINVDPSGSASSVRLHVLCLLLAFVLLVANQRRHASCFF